MDGVTLSSIFTYAAVGLGALGGLGWLKSMVYTVPQKHEALLVSLGGDVSVEKRPGLRFKAPAPFQRREAFVGMAGDQKPNTLETKTSDNVFVKLPIIVQYEVSDSKKFYFDKVNPVEQVMSLVDSSVRKHISNKTFQDLYSMDRAAFGQSVIDDVGQHCMDDFGIRIKQIVINQPEADQSVKDQYNKVQATAMEIKTAENEAQITIKRKTAEAEGDKQRDILRGEGAAGYRKKIFDQYNQQINELVEGGTPREEAVAVMMRIMELDMMREVGENNNLTLIKTDEGAATSTIAGVQALGRGKQVTTTAPAPAQG